MPRRLIALFGVALLSCISACTTCPPPEHCTKKLPEQSTPPASPKLQTLLTAAITDEYTYDKLGELCDTIGPRLTGSPGMKNAIKWSKQSMIDAGFDSVWTEPVTVPYWTRGKEWARCTAPLEFDLILSSMGLSDGTGPEGIEAEILAVRNFEELEARSSEAEGKIVLFNPPWEGYGKTVQYRVHGASVAARLGAVAVLIRSVTGTSLGAPHTGMMEYADDAPRIPIAALTVEDAGRLFRMSQRGLKPVVKLYMEATNHGETTSYNVIGDIRGTEKPEEIVLLGGHLDSWDVGTCAQDDGAGVALSLGAARLILKQDLRPLRTIRVVHFTCEEMGGHGGRAYLDAHRFELDQHILALESDAGSYPPLGFSVEADSTVVAYIDELAAPLAQVVTGSWKVRAGGSGVDVGPIVRSGVPGVGHWVDNPHYFDVHHSLADTFEKIDPDVLSRNVAVIAGLIYSVANDPVSLRSLIISPADGGH
ncbi:MAG: M28 family peptidase [bacterium]|nr:M28 family peptidase [bacterium]